MATKRTQAEFEQEAKEFESRGIQLVEGQTYATVHTLYRWRCAHDGHEWQAPFVRIAQGKGCPVCGVSSASNKNTITEEMFKQRIKEHNEQFAPTITYLSGYAGTTKKCWFKCDCCGNEWETLPKTIYTGRGCPKCGTKKAADTHTYTLEKFNELLVERNKIVGDNIEIIQYNGYGNKSTFKCKHGHTWDTRPTDVINQQSGCPHCAGNAQRSAESAVAEILSKHPKLTILTPLGATLGRRQLIEVKDQYGNIRTTTFERLMYN